MPHQDGRRVSQETFARKIGVHWVTVSAWERGKARPTLTNLVAVAEATGQPLSFFTEESGAGDDEEEGDLETALLSALKRYVDYRLGQRGSE